MAVVGGVHMEAECPPPPHTHGPVCAATSPGAVYFCCGLLSAPGAQVTSEGLAQPGVCDSQIQVPPVPPAPVEGPRV